MLALMTKQVPRTLEALLLHALPPAAAQLLTNKLEQADAAAESAGDNLAQSQVRMMHMLAHSTQWYQEGDEIHAQPDDMLAWSHHLISTSRLKSSQLEA